MNNYDQIGWVFIYIFSFGISDFIIKIFIKSKYVNLLYYLLLGIIGVLIICRKSANILCFKKIKNSFASGAVI